MTKISENFDIREFVSKQTFDEWGPKSRWFVRKELVNLAEFYKKFFTDYYKKKYPELFVVLIIINNWHNKSNNGQIFHYRAYRPPDYKGGGQESQHRFLNAFDCDIILKFKDNSTKEVDYKEVHQVIKDNWKQFKEVGLTAIEDLADAPNYLHSDMRWTGSEDLLIVNPYYA